MKKIHSIISILCAAVIFTLTFSIMPVTAEDSAKISGKILVAYFSRAGENYSVGVVEKGNTELLAEIVAEETGGDIFKIETVKEYPSSYDEMLTIVREENTAQERPELKTVIENFDSYDTIFVGYPIWWADMPMLMYTFFESYDFSGKTIVPFNTHEGSGQSGTVSTIKKLCPNAEVLNGFAVRGSVAQNDGDTARTTVQTYLSDNGFEKQTAYTIEDVRNLQDFLLNRETPDLSGKNYDLNHDNKWNVFDLCLMKRELLNRLETEAGKFNLDKGTVLLNNGREMPILGIGTYTLSDTQAENSVYWALRDGYRLIDTARIYGNEEGVGRGIQRAIDEGFVTREEIFVTTKMWTSDFGNGDAAIEASLKRLNLDYIDLMILHHSQPSNDVAAYEAMERAVKDGKLKSIGLSNFYTPEDFDRIVSQTTIKPVLLQNETHPYYQSEEMKAHLEQYHTVLESWYPLGGRGHTQTLFNDETISSIAEAHGKSSAQVILRWHLQAGNIAIPGSSNEAHIQENCEIFDFSLSEEEMAQMKALDKKERFSSY